jgi:hypothetical protein
VETDRSQMWEQDAEDDDEDDGDDEIVPEVLED